MNKKYHVQIYEVVRMLELDVIGEGDIIDAGKQAVEAASRPEGLPWTEPNCKFIAVPREIEGR